VRGRWAAAAAAALALCHLGVVGARGSPLPRPFFRRPCTSLAWHFHWTLFCDVGGTKKERRRRRRRRSYITLYS